MPTISQPVLAVLSAAELDGPRLTLVGSLDRKLYVEVNKVLEEAGGKWNRKAKAHVFDGPAVDSIDPILLTGEYRNAKQEFGQFDTPEDLARYAVDLAKVSAGMTVYEPNAGTGNIVAAVIEATGTGAGIFGCEIDPKRHAFCTARHHRAFGSGGLALADFLTIEPNPVFDRVVMNPPFAKQADSDHVLHAAKFLAVDGILVSIMSAGIMIRQDRKAVAFREFIERHNGTIERLPENAFKTSGTLVQTCIVKFSA